MAEWAPKEAANSLEKKEVLPSQVRLCAQMKLEDILEELKPITKKWQILLMKLGMKKYEIEEIEVNRPGNVALQKQDAFAQWIRQKHDACWNDIINVLFEMDENTLARKLVKKYKWKDPRIKVDTVSHINAPAHVRITAIPIPKDSPCRKSLPPLQDHQDYYTLEADPTSYSLSAEATKYFARWVREKPREGHNLLAYLRSIEENDSKSDFKIGLKARFGKMYWKFDRESILTVGSTRGDWSQSRLLRKAAFNPDIKESNVEQFFQDREKLAKEAFIDITLKFTVEGQGEGKYSANIAIYGSSGHEKFYLDTVYRQTARENRARINIALPGSKYDVRIADCSECILLEEHDSVPYKIATTIVHSIRRMPQGKLHLLLRGSTREGQNNWTVKYIRQRKQTQYKWKPERRWIVAQFDIDEFDLDTNQIVKVDSLPLNEAVDIPGFDDSRKEVELWGRQIFPKNVNETHPSKEKYYYIEGIDGVKLPGGEFREPYNWSAKDLMGDFEEFLGDAFKIANMLGGTPYEDVESFF